MYLSSEDSVPDSGFRFDILTPTCLILHGFHSNSLSNCLTFFCIIWLEDVCFCRVLDLVIFLKSSKVSVIPMVRKI